MRPRRDPKPHLHLTKEEYLKVKAFCLKHNIRWTKKRDALLLGGSRGRLEEHRYINYTKLLRRLAYEMTCRKEGRLIAIDMGGGNLGSSFY